MSETRVLASADGAVGTITLNHPRTNSYDLEFLKALDIALDSMIRQTEVKVVVLKSAMERFFSVGADINTLRSRTAAGNMKLIRFGHETLVKMRSSSKIFIAAIGGHALGGGLGIALSCDLRFAGDGDYRLGLPEVKLGLFPANGGTQRLPRLIGPTRALDLMITGALVNPREAHELGMVERLFPMGSLLEETMAYARRVAAGASLAIEHIKRAVCDGSDLSLDNALALERELFEPLLETQDAREGMAAFVEKRPPIFRGR
jgi:enoyl-CoA hydratase/carnithine racemase